MSFTSANVNDYTSNLKLLIHANQSPTNPTYFNDSSPLYHVGTTIGSTTTDADIKILGNASMLNAGSGNYVEFISATDFALSGDWTVVANFNSTTLVGDEVMVSIGKDIKNYTDVMIDGAYVRLKISNVSGNAVSILDTVPVTTNTWHNVIAMRQGNDFSIYKDGIQIGTNYTIAETFPEYTTVRIGSSVSGTAKTVTGHIDECAFWNTTIPISELYPPTEINVAIPNSITANFTASNTSGIQPLFVDFTDTSTTTDATIDAWNYSFGDGNVSSLQSPDHTYVNNGIYSVNLTITNASLSLVSTKIQTVTVYNTPNADFSSFNTAGTAPFTTYIYDTSTNLNPGPYTYYTDFGDGNTSTEQNTYFTWNITGTYDVKHCITDSVTTACNNKTAYVTVGTPTPPVVAPVASFYGSPTTGNVPLTVSFTDVSSNTPTSWNWSFGDGIYSELQNPTHAYTRSGFKNVNLTATNSAGSNITVRSKFVRVN
jgi:PKD repeat protein